MIDLMLCNLVKNFADVPKSHTIVERKFDGVRAIYYGNLKKLFNRNGVDITNNFKEIKPDFDGILDGEIVIFDTDGKDDFNAIQNHKNNNREGIFVAFDVLKVGDRSLTDMPLSQRRLCLSGLKGVNVKSILDFELPSWSDVVSKNYEGLIFKNPNSVYEFRRSPNWLKLKNFKEEVLAVKNYELTDKGFVIIVGDNEQRVSVARTDIREVIKQAFAKGLPIKATIQYLDRTKTNALRQPTFRDLQIGENMSMSYRAV